MNQPTRLFLVLLAALVIILASPAVSSVVYVKPGGSDGNSGATWSSAKQTVQAAVTAAAVGDEIWIAAGTYTGTIAVKAGVGLYGGFAGTETSKDQRSWAQNVTVLDGNDAGSVITIPSGATGTTVIDGFTIKNGSAVSGGGIYCQNGSPVIRNNKITDCFAELDGGAVYCGGSGSAQILNNIIKTNTASSGGGIQCAGSVTSNITDNTIKDNTAFHYGGGICNSDTSSPFVARNSIKGNSADFGGGLAFTDNTAATALSNVITNNNALSYGGAFYVTGQSQAKIINNTMVANSASYQGAGICCDWSSAPTIANNIVAFGSSGIYKKGSGSPALSNNCVSGNTEYNYSGLTAGSGDIDVDPAFLNRAGDYHLTGGSLCLDKGNNGVIQSGWSDMDSQARIYGASVDIGADESMPYTPSVPVNVSLTPNSGKLLIASKTTFTAAYSDSEGFADLSKCLLLINTAASGNNAAYAYYDANGNKLYLCDNGKWLGGYAPGSASVIEGSFCKLYCAETTKTGSGSNLTIKWRMEIKPAMTASAYSAWMRAYDDSGQDTNWVKKADFTVNKAPSNVSLTPNAGQLSVNTKQTFTAVYSDPNGINDLSKCLLLINTAASGNNAAYAYYDANGNKLYLCDNGKWLGGYAPGSASVIEGSFCKLYCAETTKTGSGSNLTIKWTIALKSTMAGKTCPAWMMVYDDAMVNTGWQQKGSFMIQ